MQVPQFNSFEEQQIYLNGLSNKAIKENIKTEIRLYQETSSGIHVSNEIMLKLELVSRK